MKQNKLKFLLSLIMILCALCASAYDFMVDGIAYYKNGTEAIVTYTEYSSDNYSGLSGSLVIPNTVTFDGVNYTVTSIGYGAFYRCSGLTSVTIPNSVTSIGVAAFYECSALTSVTIPNSVSYIGRRAFQGTIWFNNQPDGMVYAGLVAYKYKGTMPSGTSIILRKSTRGIAGGAFQYCSGLTSVTIPNSVISIGDYVFDGCTGLASVTIPNSVTSIGYGAFYECSALTSVTISNSVTSIGYEMFYKCGALTSVTIPNSVTSIDYGAFYECSALTSVTIPNSVTSIGGYAFRLCSALTNVTIPNSVTFIGDYAFSLCSSLTSVTIPNSITTINIHAFQMCSSLTSVTIPYSVTSIGGYAFDECSALTSVNIPSSVSSIGEYAFRECSSLTSVNIPSSVTSIGKNAFSYCSSLTSVNINDLATWCEISFDNKYSNPLYYAHHLYLNGTEVTKLVIPNSVTSISDYAFECCYGLKSVTIPSSVTSIGDFAFDNCYYSLTSVEIPSSVTSIGDGVFCRCTALSRITVAGGNPNYDSRDNCNAIIETAANTLIQGCTSTIIPISVTSIGDFAFYGSGLRSVTIPNSVTSIGYEALACCNSLTSLYVEDGNIRYDSREYCNAIIETAANTLIQGCQNTIIPNSVTSIGDEAFWCCTALTSVTIPNSVTSIGSWAFHYCTGLTSVTIPSSVTSIGEYAFDDCRGLTSVTSLKRTATLLPNSAFSDYTKPTLYVRNGSSGSYANTTHWNRFINIVELSPYNSLDLNSLSHTRGETETMVDLPITLSNDDTLSGLQFDIYLPDCVSFNEVNGVPDVWLDENRKTRSHSLSINQIDGYSSDGKYYRVLIASSTAKDLKGNDGDLVHMNIKLHQLHDAGNFFIQLYNIVASEADETRHDLSSVQSTVHCYYIVGDADGNASVDIADYAATASKILERKPSPFYSDAADVSHDWSINVVDLVGITNISLEIKPITIRQAPAINDFQDRLLCDKLQVSAGSETDVTIGLDGSFHFAGFQMDVKLPQGLTLMGATLREDASELSLATERLLDGTVRLLGTSFADTDVNGICPKLLTLRVKADNNYIQGKNIELSDIIFAERNLTAHYFDGECIEYVEPSYVLELKEDARIYVENGNIIVDTPFNGTVQLITIDGRMTEYQAQIGHNVYEVGESGIYIVHFNGKTVKVLL